MRKIILLIILLPTFVLASSNDEIFFNIEDEFFNTINKQAGEITTFNLNNNILNINITEEQLNSILSQNINNDIPNLNYYLKLKLVLNNNNNKYIGYNSSWNNNINKSTLAYKSELYNYYYPFGFKIKYRNTIDSIWITQPPDDNNLINKSLKQKLAYLLNINEEEVVSNYKKLYVFEPLNNGTLYFRFDIYDNDSNSNSINTSNINYFITKYVKINYSSEELISTFYEYEEKPNIIPGIIFIVLLLGSTIIIKKKNLIDFSL